MFKRALVTTYDKSGLYEFLRPLVDKGLQLVSTGGTASFLKSKGLPVEMVENQTNFPELLEGRVKTLHPFVHIPILARAWRKEDKSVLDEYKLAPFDLVICNLYPFDEHKDEKEDKKLVEWIDIGGPTLLRAAAKNFFSITTLCRPEDYKEFEQGTSSLEQRKKLASVAFQQVSRYDACISASLSSQQSPSLQGSFFKGLRYGENPKQKAEWYKEREAGLHQAEILQGRELSFNNLMDLESSSLVLREFSKTPCAVAVKHNQPCGVACRPQLKQALQACLQADSQSVFGGVIALNREVDEESAMQLVDIFLEVILAPSYSKKALDILARKKNLRLLTWPTAEGFFAHKQREFKQVLGGFLLQDRDQLVKEWDTSWKLVGSKPSKKIQDDLMFAWKVCAYLKSNAVALAKDQQTIGLGMGQVSRVMATDIALQRYKQVSKEILQDVVAASDAFFPFPDAIEKLAAQGVRWIIQPGGSVRDDEVIKKAQDLGVSMVITNQRHFRH